MNIYVVVNEKNERCSNWKTKTWLRKYDALQFAERCARMFKQKYRVVSVKVSPETWTVEAEVEV